MCFRQSRYRDENVEEARGKRLWGLFYRETEEREPPLPVVEHEEEQPVSEREREEVPAGSAR
jgi:hypothetical protein